MKYQTIIVKAQSIFNIRSNVINKTESWSVAEWSVRSTLAYTAVVASNHFIPGIARTIYHPKRKDLNKEALVLWELAERSYSKMLGNIDKKSKPISNFTKFGDHY